MKKIRLSPALLFKFVIGVFLVAAVFVIVQNFVNRSRIRPRVPVVSDEITEQKVETTDEIQHYQLRKGEIHLEVRGDKHYIGQDGLFHLEGNVQFVFKKRADGEDVVLTAREIVHDPEYSFVRALGEARLQAGDLTMESEWLEYRTEEEILRTDQPIQFASDRISGSALEAEYRDRTGRLLLRKDVDLTLTSAQEPPRRVSIQGEELDYRHRGRTGTVSGDVRVESETSSARAQFMRFELFSNRENLKSALLQEDVQVVGLSILSGAHMTLVPRIIKMLEEQGLVNVKLFLGGIIPDEDKYELEKIGVTGIYGPGTSTQLIIKDIQNACQ